MPLLCYPFAPENFGAEALLFNQASLLQNNKETWFSDNYCGEYENNPSNPAIYRGGNRSSVSPALAMTDKHLLHCGLKPKDGSDSVSPR